MGKIENNQDKEEYQLCAYISGCPALEARHLIAIATYTYTISCNQISATPFKIGHT